MSTDLMADLERLAKFPAGTPADPTKNMSPEQKAEWEAMKDKHGDKFKTGKTAAEVSVRVHGKEWVVEVRSRHDVTIYGPDGDEESGSLSRNGELEDFMEVPDPVLEALEREIKRNSRKMRLALDREAGCEKLPEGPMRDNCESGGPIGKGKGKKKDDGDAKSKGKGEDKPKDGKMPADLLEKFKSKKKADEEIDLLADMLKPGPEDGIEFPWETEVVDSENDGDLFAEEFDLLANPVLRNRLKGKGKRAEDEDEKEAGFEKGKPADPTENMSDEDKAEWNKQKALNKDKFKSAGATGPDPKGRDWKKLENPTRWMWGGMRHGVSFTVFEKPGPGEPIYILHVLNDHGMFKHIRPFQWKTPEEAFKVAAKWFPIFMGENISLDMRTNWSKVGSGRDKMAMADGDFLASEFDLLADGCPDNLDEEACGEWEANTERHKDKFKSAGCEKLPNEAMQQQCEDKKEEGKKASREERYVKIPLLGVSPYDRDEWVEAAQKHLGRFFRCYGTHTVGDVQVLNVTHAATNVTLDEWVREMSAAFNDLVRFLLKRGAKVDKGMLGSYNRAFAQAVKGMGKQADFEPGEVDDTSPLDGDRSEGSSDIPDGEGNREKRASELTDQASRLARFLQDMGVPREHLGMRTATTNDVEVVSWWIPRTASEEISGEGRMSDTFMGGMKGMGFRPIGRSAWGSGMVTVTTDVSRRGTTIEVTVPNVTRTAAQAPGGLYGFPKKVQADCEASARKVARQAAVLAKRIYAKDAKVADFLGTHAKRSKSLTAKVLLNAMQEIGPRIASEKEAAGFSIGKIRDGGSLTFNVGDTYAHIWFDVVDARTDFGGRAKDAGEWQVIISTSPDPLNQKPRGKELGRKVFRYVETRAKSLVQSSAESWIQDNLVRFGRRASEKADEEPVSQLPDEGESAPGKTASDYGLYGFRAKTASLGLGACSELREATGRMAYDLHKRRASRHAQITSFLKTHCKEAKCASSQLLSDCYPDADCKVASAPTSVNDWLSWED